MPEEVCVIDCANILERTSLEEDDEGKDKDQSQEEDKNLNGEN